MLTLLLACRPAPEGPSAAPAGPSFAFDLGGGLFDAPFPNVRRFEGGTAAVDDWPNPDHVPYVDVLLDLAASATGAGTTSGIVFRRDDPDTALVPVDAARSLDPDAPAFLVALDGPDAGARIPVDLWDQPDGGPFGAPGLATLLPVQGVPLRPGTTYAAVLRRSLGADGPLGVPASLWTLEGDGWTPASAAAYRAARATLEAWGVPRQELAALAVFRTWDPVGELVPRRHGSPRPGFR